MIEGRQDEDAGGAAEPDDLARGLDAVEHRHPDVHEQDIRLALPRQPDGRGAVCGLADDFDAVLDLQDHPETRPDEGLVIGERDGDHSGCVRGRWARTSNPPPTRLPAVKVPPNRAARSRMPTRP